MAASRGTGQATPRLRAAQLTGQTTDRKIRWKVHTVSLPGPWRVLLRLVVRRDVLHCLSVPWRERGNEAEDTREVRRRTVYISTALGLEAAARGEAVDASCMAV